MPAFIIVRSIFLITVVSLVILDIVYLEISFYVYLIITGSYLILLATGSAKIEWNFFTHSLSSFSTNEKAVAITFDDGPSEKYTPEILNLLTKFKARATFFSIGKKIVDHPELLKEIRMQGHAVGNHSYSHSNFFSFYRKRKVIKEINKTNQVIHEATGEPCILFRPPYGVTNPSIAKALKATGLKSIGWNIRSFDTSYKDPNIVINRVLSKIKPGAIILLHDDRPNTAKILEAILLYTQQHDYKCIAIDEIQNLKHAS